TERPEISAPYDPVHLTHIPNSSTGDFSGVPKEWVQLLKEIGVLKLEEEMFPQDAMEIVKFNQEVHRVVWDKMG
ncbi:hypothetical protein BT96DRAFT_777020, partial [Gymnopus androsaceus JB14]